MNGNVAGAERSDRARSVVQRILAEVPPISDHRPLSAALERARELGERQLVSAVKSFVSMPQSTRILANPVLYSFPIQCDGREVTMKVRGFALRGALHEAEIVRGDASAVDVVFTGLFGRRPGTVEGGIDEALAFGAFLDDECYGAVGLCERPSGRDALDLDSVVGFVARNLGAGPETAMHAALVERKANSQVRGELRGVNEDREPAELLVDMIATHLENVVTGVAAIVANRVLASESSVSRGDVSGRVRAVFARMRDAGRPAFDAVYDALLGRPVGERVARILRIMGTIQTHHGSAGSNVVARYMAALHVGNVYDFFAAAHMALDGDRHFGAIHDMTRLIEQLEGLDPTARDEAVRRGVTGGGLPTYGHPEIAAAGRGDELQLDPRPAIYLHPLFEAVDDGSITIERRNAERLGIAQRIYQIAFVEGVKKPGREEDAPLRLTPNTDFGAWCIQEALGIRERDRTFLTYVFRGFGWMMDAREQLQQRIMRPVIPPDPAIVPKGDGDETIPDMVRRMHERMSGSRGFGR